MSMLRDYYESMSGDVDDIDERQLQEIMEQAEWEADNQDESDEGYDEETV